MKLAIITLVQHTYQGRKYYGYGPYVREMNLWGKYVDELLVVGIQRPDNIPTGIDSAYDKDIVFTPVPDFNILTLLGVLKSFFAIPVVFFRICKVMHEADHIHLRCPAHVSLVASVAQIFFPNKPKSTKYAGNWDPNSGQPWTYRLQQAILRNTFLTRNMKVLVYGDWQGETKNIYPFISATYTEDEKVVFKAKDYAQPLIFVFAGMLVPGKRPLLTIQFIEKLNKKGVPAQLELFGDGPLMPELEVYVREHNLESSIFLRGNCDKSEVKAALLKSHFNILLSKSEGWPKAVAEGMFFGCIPVATSVSCVGWMMGHGTRGILVNPELETAVAHFLKVYKTENLELMALKALQWSQQYTFDRLENDIRQVLDGSFKSWV
ncbi:glycosyltransferase family 4 protein [Formosa sp. S-31]|uniref:glycosyltransferase family 4 protein n=1 Tax=Formosa sp. S-31 TaxID=2790949 RepID=UPI003EBFED10